MSVAYDSYLINHVENVKKGFLWMRENIPEVLVKGMMYEEFVFLRDSLIPFHDKSKNDRVEYLAYDRYFYGGNHSFEVVEDFRRAWLMHIHTNPHHWQHWVLINDDPNEGEIVVEMPVPYVIEMICDWWSFSWKNGDLTMIFSWYEKNKNYIKLHENTRKRVEDILNKIKEVLDKENWEDGEIPI